MKRQSEKSKKNSKVNAASLAETAKFLKSYPNLYAPAKLLGVSAAACSGWLCGLWRPSKAIAEKMEELSNGLVSAEIIRGNHAKFCEKTFSEFIINRFLKAKAKQINVDIDFYLEHYTPHALQEIIESNELKDVYIPSLIILLGADESYWKGVQKTLRNKNK